MATRRVEIPDISSSHISAKDAIAQAVRLLESALAKARYVIPRSETKGYLEMRRDLPYVVHETELPGTQILVNRNYKPLGNSSRTGAGWVKYEECRNMHVKLTSEQIRSFAGPGRERALFGDGDPPWAGRKEAKAYLERLKKLSALV